LLTIDKLRFIAASITCGASPGTIQYKLGTVTSPVKLAYLYPKVAGAGQTKRQHILNAVQHWKSWIILPDFADTGCAQMERYFLIHLRVANGQFASEVLIMDHSFCASHLNLPGVSIIVEDRQAPNQLLA
jgi:hypothetical protein